MEFKKELFRKDIKQKRLVDDEKSLDIACKEIGISKSTLSRAEKGKDVTIDSFVRLISWMGVSPYKYIQ